MPEQAVRHEELAAELARARRDRSTIAPPSERFDGFTTDDAREVLRWLGRSARHDPVAGVKIGLTSTSIWERLGVHEPFVAEVRQSGIERGSSCSLRRCTSPRVEPEVVVTLRTALAVGADRREVIDAIDAVGLGFEVVDSHYPGWTAKPVDLVADHGCHAGLVLGEQVPATRAVLEALGDLEVAIAGPSESLLGRGSDVLGHPVDSIVAALSCSTALALDAGAVVSTGSLTGRSHPATEGETWTASVSGGPSLPDCTVELT